MNEVEYEQSRAGIREWAANNLCSCEGRIHDPENLMQQLLDRIDNKCPECGCLDGKHSNSCIKSE